MKIKCKIAVWFWLITIAGNIAILYALTDNKEGQVSLIILLICLFIYNLIFLPILIRNYILIDRGTLTLHFGFSKETINIFEIIEIRRTHTPIASSAASLDRLIIKTKRQALICAVRHKDQLFDELKRQNPQIIIH